jgi:hypothetical protein
MLSWRASTTSVIISIHSPSEVLKRALQALPTCGEISIKNSGRLRAVVKDQGVFSQGLCEDFAGKRAVPEIQAGMENSFKGLGWTSP